MASRGANIRSDSKYYNVRLPLNLRSLSPFSDNFDPGALWGLRTMIRRGAKESIKLYLFIFLLTVADALFLGLNLITPARTRENVVPRPFSPRAPPRFRDHPFVFALCKLCLWLGPLAPQWVQEWSTWDGLLPDGYWPSVDRKVDLSSASRSPCPGLNALANHGIINKSGGNLNFHRIASRISRTYNLSPPLAIQLLSAALPLFEQSGEIDLYTLTTHGLIEHDASLLRPDLYKSTLQDQTQPHQDLIEEYFPEQLTHHKTHKLHFKHHNEKDDEAGETRLKHSDFSKMLEKRREECKTKNPSFHDKFLFKFFGSGNCALFMEVFDGKLCDIRPFIGAGISIGFDEYLHHHYRRLPHHYRRLPHLQNRLAERAVGFLDLTNLEVLPHGQWRPSNLHHPWGLTIFKLIYSTLKIEART